MDPTFQLAYPKVPSEYPIFWYVVYSLSLKKVQVTLIYPTYLSQTSLHTTHTLSVLVSNRPQFSVVRYQQQEHVLPENYLFVLEDSISLVGLVLL